MTQAEQAAFKRIKTMLGEHFDNFAFVILDENGDIFYSFKNRIVGKALLIEAVKEMDEEEELEACLLYTSPSPRDRQKSRMPSSA